MDNLAIQRELLEKWMEYIRNNSENSYRFSECFWPSQLKSKEYIIQCLKPHLEWAGKTKSVFIFGGWYGIFAQLLNQYYPHNYTNIDSDPSCQKVFEEINISSRIRHVTACMSNYSYSETPDLVINTSTEHVPQEVYDKWWNNIPTGTKYLIQGNNFFDCNEHIRCSNSLQEFIETNHAQNCDMRDTIDVGFERYIAMGVK